MQRDEDGQLHCFVGLLLADKVLLAALRAGNWRKFPHLQTAYAKGR